MSVLVNFRMSEHLKILFDDISSLKHQTKTQIINSLIEDFVRRESRYIQNDQELASQLKATVSKIEVKEPTLYYPPNVFISNTAEDW